jgi:drug/metabolite transporter (DMT)-like permease
MAVLPATLKPAETVTWYNLVLLGVIGGIGVMILSENIKDKSSVPVRDIAIWGGLVPAFVTALSVYFIAKSAKKSEEI